MAKRDESPEHEEPVVHDKRRIDPETGKVRPTPDAVAADSASADAASGGAASDLEHEQVIDTGEGGSPDLESSLSDADLDFLSGQATAEELAAERLADLQRVTAEYANYRKRTETGREVERERSVAETAKALLPVLDDLDRAEKHGDLEGESAFATIAAKLRGVAEKLGLASFGTVGEPFDHNVHEAIFQQPTAGVETDTVADVVETGYTLGSTLVRAAKVVVAVPE
ncbi:nucleotide exchange factor GrpE [Rathayibacter soli]|uniref:nucleotide exchange factor GrpE n=1 Tax=Rathayibacter soli TaxID=3144168 RepID=UPI0027E4A02D|nr:nucleotide exchange factor GrpE [Glaciibacter superstes]